MESWHRGCDSILLIDSSSISGLCRAAPIRHRTVRAGALGQRTERPLVRIGGLLTKGSPSDIVLPVAGASHPWGAPPPNKWSKAMDGWPSIRSYLWQCSLFAVG